MKKGFTLIELLIVVLIIGILASIALPNYTKAVEKSRYSAMMPLAASVKTAEEAFYLADASYSADLEALDVNVPGEISGSSATLDDGTQVQVNADGEHDYVKLSKNGLNNTYVMYFNKSSNYPGEIHCEALSDNERAKSLCENLGGEELGTGVTSGYTAYVLSGTGAGSATTTPSDPTPSPEPEPEPTPEPTPTPEPETPSGSLGRNDLSSEFQKYFRDMSDDDFDEIDDENLQVLDRNSALITNPDGSVAYKAVWDPEDNLMKYYDGNDRLMTESLVENGQVVGRTFYDQNGTLRDIKKQNSDGSWCFISYDENGQLIGKSGC